MNPLYQDRHHAGRILGENLRAFAGASTVVVVGLARGGVPVASEVAKILNAPLDVLVVRKLGMPGNEELALGAVAPGGIGALNSDILNTLENPNAIIKEAVEREERELDRRDNLYRDGRPPLRIEGNTVILTDDGLATGATMRAAVRWLRHHGVARCIIAVPVGAVDTCASLRFEADEVMCLETPEPFVGVGRFYQDFSQTSDDEVQKLLRWQPL